MKAIKFTDQELESMIEMYKAELEYAQNDVANIQEILKKLGSMPVKDVAGEKETKPGKKRGPKPSVKAVEISEPKKRGRKPKTVVPATEALITAAKPAKKAKAAKPKKEKIARVNAGKPVKKAGKKKAADEVAPAEPVASAEQS